MTPPTDLLGSCAPSLVHAERDSRFIMDGDVTLAGHLCYIMLLPNAQGKIVKAGTTSWCVLDIPLINMYEGHEGQPRPSLYKPVRLSGRVHL